MSATQGEKESPDKSVSEHQNGGVRKNRGSNRSSAGGLGQETTSTPDGVGEGETQNQMSKKAERSAKP